MSKFILTMSCLTTSNFPWFMGPNLPDSYAILFFTASDCTFTTSHIHSWVLFLLWLSLFIPSGIISPLFSSSILGTYQPGEFIFQCHIFLPFHTVHEVLKQEYWSGLTFSSPVDHILSKLSTMTHPSWAAPYGMAHSFIELDKAVIHVISWLVFCDGCFHSVCPLMDENKKLVEASWWEGLILGKTGSCSGEWGHAQ